MPLDLAVSPRASPGCERCYDFALMDRYPADEYCEESPTLGHGIGRGRGWNRKGKSILFPFLTKPTFVECVLVCVCVCDYVHLVFV